MESLAFLGLDPPVVVAVSFLLTIFYLLPGEGRGGGGVERARGEKGGRTDHWLGEDNAVFAFIHFALAVSKDAKCEEAREWSMQPTDSFFTEAYERSMS